MGQMGNSFGLDIAVAAANAARAIRSIGQKENLKFQASALCSLFEMGCQLAPATITRITFAAALNGRPIQDKFQINQAAPIGLRK